MSAPDLPHADGVHRVADEPLGPPSVAVWQVGQTPRPSAPDPVSARSARLEARLAVYAQYAAVLAEEAAAAVGGDEARRAGLATTRGATAEHFAELCETPQLCASGPLAFADALTDALHELRHQDAVDVVLAEQLRALRGAAAVRGSVPALAAGGPPAPRLDLRF